MYEYTYTYCTGILDTTVLYLYALYLNCTYTYCTLLYVLYRHTYCTGTSTGIIERTTDFRDRLGISLFLVALATGLPTDASRESGVPESRLPWSPDRGQARTATVRTSIVVRRCSRVVVHCAVL